jgi:hypothetical protein
MADATLPVVLRFADAQDVAARKRIVAAIRTEAARYTAPDPEERAYRDGLRLAANIAERQP